MQKLSVSCVFPQALKFFVMFIGLSCELFLFAHFVCKQGGQIFMTGVNNHWSDNLIPSPSKKRYYFSTCERPWTTLVCWATKWCKKYVCFPQAKCRSNQRHHHFVPACFTNVPSQKGKFYSGDCVAAHSGDSFTLVILLQCSEIVTLFLHQKLKPFLRANLLSCKWPLLLTYSCTTCFRSNVTFVGIVY